MIDERYAVVELADELQVRKQRIFKLLKRLRIVAAKQRDPDRRNQFVSTVSASEAKAIRNEIKTLIYATELDVADGRDGLSIKSFAEDKDIGYFYLVQLEPEFDPGRIKVGFSSDVEGRLRQHRSVAPYAKILRIWLCRRVWERTAIDSITMLCQRLHTEVFRADALESVIKRADSFFSMMPVVNVTENESDTDLHLDEWVALVPRELATDLDVSPLGNRPDSVAEYFAAYHYN